jgi:hypothetical protein
LKKPPKKDIAAIWKDWRGRDVYLLKSILRYHVTTYHIEETFVLEQLKAIFHQPVFVARNKNAGSDNAVYDLPCDGKPWMLVAVSYGMPFVHVCSLRTMYAVNNNELPNPSWKVVFGKRPPNTLPKADSKKVQSKK